MPRAASPDLAGALNAWFADAARPLPWRAAEVSHWAVLVSEFMLQQTQVARVAPRWEAWIERWPTPCSASRSSRSDGTSPQWRSTISTAARCSQSARRG